MEKICFILFTITILLFSAFGTEQQPLGRSAHSLLLIYSNNASNNVRLYLSEGMDNSISRQDHPCTIEVLELNHLVAPDINRELFELDRYIPYIQNHTYDLIIVFSEQAANVISRRLDVIPADVPILYSNISRLNPEWRQKHPNSSAVIRNITPVANIELGIQLFPQSKYVYLLVGNADISDEQLSAYRAACGNNAELRIIFFNEKTPGNIEQIQMELANAPENSILVMHNWEYDIPTKNNSDQYFQQIKAAYQGPIFASRRIFVDQVFGGITQSVRQVGLLTWQIAEQIISGPAMETHEERYCPEQIFFNAPELERFNLAESALPPNALIINRPPSWIVKHLTLLTHIAIVLCIVIVFLTAILLFHFRTRRHLKHSLSVLDSLPGRVTVFACDGRILYFHRESGVGNIVVNEKYRSLEQTFWANTANIRDAIATVSATGNSLVLDYDCMGIKRSASFAPIDKSVFGENAVICVSIDSHRLQDAGQAAKLEAKRFALTLQSISEAVIATDIDESIQLVNAEATRIIGISAAQLQGKIFPVAMPLEASPEIPSLLREAMVNMRSITTNNFKRYVNTAGQEFYLNCTAAPIIDDNGKLLGGIFMFRDQTERYHQQAMLSQNQSLINNACYFLRASFFRYNIKTGKSIILDGTPGFRARGNHQYLPISEWLTPESHLEMQKALERMTKNEINRFSLHVSARQNNIISYYRILCNKIADSVDEVSGVIVDETENRTSIEQLKNDLTLATAIINTMPFPIFAKDIAEEFRYLHINKFFHKQLNLKPEDVINHTDYEIMCRPADAEMLRSHDRQVSSADSAECFEFTEEYILPDGSLYTSRSLKQILQLPNGKRLLLGATIDESAKVAALAKQDAAIKALNYQLNNAEMIKRCLAQSVINNNFSSTVNELLKTIAQFQNAQRCWLMAVKDEFFEVSAEWYDSVPSHKKIYSFTELTGWMEKLTQDLPVIFELNNDKDNGLDPDVKSLIAVGIKEHDLVSMVIGFEFLHQPHHINASDINTLKDAGNIYLLLQEKNFQEKFLAGTDKIQNKLLTQTPIAMAVFNTQRRCLYANTAFDKLAEDPQHVSVGSNCSEFCRLNYNKDCTTERCPLVAAIKKHRACTIENAGFHITVQPMQNAEATVPDDDDNYMVTVKDLRSELKKLEYYDNRLKQNKFLYDWINSIDLDATLTANLQNLLAKVAARRQISNIIIMKNVENDAMHFSVHTILDDQKLRTAQRIVLENRMPESYIALQRGNSLYHYLNAKPDLELSDCELELQNTLEMNNWHALIAAPIILHNQLWGNLLFVQDDVNDNFDQLTVELADLAAKTIEIMLDISLQTEEIAGKNSIDSEIFANAPAAMMLLDNKKRLITANAAAGEIFGVRLEDFISKRCKEFCTAARHPEICNMNSCPICRTISSKTTVENEFTHNQYVYKITSLPLLGLDNKLKYVLASISNISESYAQSETLTQQKIQLQEAEEQLASLVEQDKIIMQSLELLMREKDTDATFISIITMLNQQINACDTIIMRYCLNNGNANFIRYKTVSSQVFSTQPPTKAYLNISENSFADAFAKLKRGEIIHENIDNLTDKISELWQKDIYQYLKADKISEVIIVPLFTNNSFWGYLSCSVYNPEAHFNKSARRMLSRTARVLELLIEQAEQPLAVNSSELQRRRLINLLGFPIFILNADLNIMEVNPAAATLFNKPESQLTGLKFTQIHSTPWQPCPADIAGKTLKPCTKEKQINGKTYLVQAIPEITHNRLDKIVVIMLNTNNLKSHNPVSAVEVPSPQPPEIKTTEGIKELTVLVVDDVPMNVKVLSSILKKLGCRCFTADNGRDGLKLLDTIQPQIVFTDLWMPGMNGLEFAHNIRKHKNGQTVKLYAVTADAEYKNNFDTTIFNEVLLKPVTLNKVCGIID